ncbi:MAG TPA: zinc-binding dehydrogenase [Verrucomicrobiae bacterium]|jgi:NADPH:quinone reductase-like Zn-dependent oxidoreductase|nr:zinc-binding dehydrogenase [Verrucomicrobiae bacterium]
MKAIRFHEFGGPEVLKFEDVPDPVLRKDQVLVRVKACALNHLDLFIRKGLPNVKLPHINGSDVSGEIAEVGEYITDLKAGQRVMLAPMTFCGYCQACMSGQQNMCPRYSVLGYFNDGGNAEYIAAPRANALPIPEPEAGDALTHDEAASLPLVFVTAWHMLVARCHIKPGDTVLVLGGGSGVGSAAIQIGKMFGAQVIATAGDENKLEQSRELGADHVINHYKQKISDEVKKITNKGLCDIVFEHVGKATWMESMKSLKPGGSLVTCGATTGPEASFDIRFLFGRQLSFLGSFMGTMGDFHEVMKHVFSGKLKAVVDRRFPLREAAAAHQRLENGEQFGKVILNP